MADDVTFTIGAVDNASRVIKAMNSSWTEFQNKLRTVQMAVQTVGRAVDATVGEFVKYANQVRTITQVTGQSAEAVSKMIQMADDYKISAEQLTFAMKKMANEGITLTTEALADLSDEYLKLNPGMERQAFLTEKFGRSGIAFAEIMSQGGVAIRAQSDAIESNLILTDKAVKQAREYEIAVDDLSDAWMGLKISAGQIGIPILTQAVKLLSIGSEAASGAKKNFSEFAASVIKGGLSAKNAASSFSELTHWAAETIEKFNLFPPPRTMTSWAQGMYEAQLRAKSLGEQIDALAGEAEDYSQQLSDVTSYAKAYDQSQKDLKTAIEEMDAAQRAAIDFEKANPHDAEGLKALVDKYQESKDKVKALQDAEKRRVDEFIYGILLQSLAIDGISSKDMQFLLDYQVRTGQLTDEARDRAQQQYDIAVTQAAMIKGIVDGIPSYKMITVEMVLAGAGNVSSWIESFYAQQALNLLPAQTSTSNSSTTNASTSNSSTSNSSTSNWTTTGGSYATGGIAKDYFIAGDPGPQEELIYAPGGAFVYTAAQTRAMKNKQKMPHYSLGSSLVSSIVSDALVMPGASPPLGGGQNPPVMSDMQLIQSNNSDQAILAQLKGIENLLRSNLTNMPKQWAAAAARTI